MFVEIITEEELTSLANDPKPLNENKRTGMYISERLPCMSFTYGSMIFTKLFESILLCQYYLFTQTKKK